MEELGTLQQVRDFMADVAKFRERSGRRLTVILIHHENKGGAVSGAWEGAGTRSFTPPSTLVARRSFTFRRPAGRASGTSRPWSSTGPTVRASRSAGGGPRSGCGDRRIAHGEAAPDRGQAAPDGEGDRRDEGGRDRAGEADVKRTLEANQDRFTSRTKEAAKAVGRHPSGTVWEWPRGALTAQRTSTHLRSPGEERGKVRMVHSPFRDAPTPTHLPYLTGRCIRPRTHPPHRTPIRVTRSGDRER